MGLYDTVTVPCPTCGKVEYFQSKGSDECYLRNFTLENAPDDVMSDVNRHAPYSCERCGATFGVNVKTRTPTTAFPLQGRGE